MDFRLTFQFVVPKRAALLLDRLMVALHHALEDDTAGDGGGRKINKVYKDSKYLGSIKAPPTRTELMKTYYTGILDI